MFMEFIWKGAGTDLQGQITQVLYKSCLCFCFYKHTSFAPEYALIKYKKNKKNRFFFKLKIGEINKKEENFDTINKLTNAFIESSGLIICAPEYNGSIPPIITNMIAWISVSTDNWRDGFNKKVSFKFLW